MKINNDKKINYLVLCELTFDKKLFNEITINEKVNTLVEEIETDFVNEYSKKYNLIIINEK